MKTYLIDIKYAWSKNDLERSPQYETIEVLARNKKDAITICKFKCDNQYFHDIGSLPMYYEILKVNVGGK